MLARAAVVLLLASAAFVAYPVTPAAAEFLATGSGPALATSQSIPVSAPPVPVVTGREVTLSWSVTTLTGGTPAASYTVRRYDTSDVAQTVLAGCDVVTTTSCVENNVPIGTWTYSVQAGLGSWLGAEGSESAPVTVATSSFVLDSTAPIVSLPAAVPGTIANFLVGETLTYRLDSTTGPVLAGSPSTVTSSTSMAVNVTVPAGTSDAPHSVFVVGSGGSFAAAAIDIVIPPLLQSMQMRDVDGNGKVDQVTVVFDDTLAAYTAGIAPWTLANVPSGGTLASVIVTGATATLTIAEGPGAANTAVGSFTVALSANSAGVRDVNEHLSSFAATAPTDVAPPIRLTLTMQDITTVNGKVDRLTMSFSEPLAAYTAPNTIWTLTNVPSGGALASVTVTSPSVTIAITEGAGVTDTSVGSFTAALAMDAAGIRDAAGNLASFAAAAPADGAKPMRRLGEMFDDNADGKVDRVLITFSETLAPFTAPATVFTLASAPSGATLNNVTVSANTATLALNQGAGAATTAVGAFTNALAVNAAGIRDAAGNLSSFTSVAPTDRAAPALLTLRMLDNDIDGRVDRATALFSETLAAYTAGTTPWTLTNVPSGGTHASVTLASATLTLVITEGAGAADTTVGAMTVAMAANAAGARDAAGNQSSFAASTPLDAAAPVAITVSLLDNNGNGKVDSVTALFSETLSVYTAGTTPWTLANVPSGGTLANVTLASATLTLTLNEGAGAANTTIGTMTVAMATNAGGARDAAGNLSSFTARAPLDRAAPVLLTLSLLDNNGNGKVDRVTALFTETLAAYTAGTTPWTLTNVPSGGTLASVTRAAATLTLTLTEGAGFADTTVGTMTVGMAANAAGARDAAGNQSSFAATTPLDAARPAPLTINDTNGTTVGRAEPGDTLVIIFSEPLATGSVPATTTVTLTDPVGAGNDTLTMSGLSNGAGTTGTTNHVTFDGGVAAFANSAVALSNANKTITVTVGAACAGTGCPTTAGAVGTYSFLAAPTLTDVASNVASTVAKLQSIQLF
jgi:hypothetical protein